MKLNVGSGILGADSPWADWVNVDFAAFEADKGDWSVAEYLKFDVRKKWPLEDGVADCIFASHIFEHVEHNLLSLFAAECYRVLKPGAPIRMICPDPRVFIRNWQMGNLQYIKDCYGMQNWERWDYEHMPHMGFTDMFFPDHYAHTICSAIELAMIHLIRAGFDPVAEMNYGNSMFPEFFGTDQPVAGNPEGNPKTMDNRPGMSWYLEAVK